MKEKNIEVLMIGPAASKTLSGGIVAVIDNIVQHLDKKFIIKRIITMRPSERIVKRLGIYLRALFLIFISSLNKNQKIAHVHMASKNSFYRKSFIIILLKLCHIPILIHLHGGKFHIFFSKELNPIMQKYVKWIFSLADKTILLSHNWQKWYKETINTSASVVIYNGVKSYYNKNSLPLEKRNNTILFLGRLDTNKGIYDLLYSFKDVLETVPDAMLKVGGDGEVRKCKEFVKELNIETQVEFLGWVPEENKYQLFNESKIYILPSYNEGLPMGLLEAISAGIAVISTKVGGIPEIIENGNNGLLIEPGSKKQISKSIIFLLKNPDKSTQLGIKAKEQFLNSFDIKNITKQIEKEYYEIIS